MPGGPVGGTEPPMKAGTRDQEVRRVVGGRCLFSQGKWASRDPQGVRSKLAVREMAGRSVGVRTGPAYAASKKISIQIELRRKVRKDARWENAGGRFEQKAATPTSFVEVAAASVYRTFPRALRRASAFAPR
jgi:hypothetical protein